MPHHGTWKTYACYSLTNTCQFRLKVKRSSSWRNDFGRRICYKLFCPSKHDGGKTLISLTSSASAVFCLLFRTIVEILMRGETIVPEWFAETTVHFSSVTGFQETMTGTAKLPPGLMIDKLNQLYNVCDEVISRFDVFKVEVVGDVYLVRSRVHCEWIVEIIETRNQTLST